MGGLSFPMSCKICCKPVDLTVDLYADENGKIVHEVCYMQRITLAQTLPSIATMTDQKVRQYRTDKAIKAAW
ncbi:MAG: hypothetical protein ABSF97_21320 [Candidatus Sulfotelmatobacter sp.]|jgi:hypothetical protein